MAGTNQAIEAQVGVIGELRRTGGGLRLDREFSSLMEMLKPRIIYLVRRYGLVDMYDDARQACAIAVHTAIHEYDDRKASFSTFVTWKMRGELQTLRYRMRLDQRPVATRMSARTVSLEGMAADNGVPAYSIIDEDAERHVESAASAMMARHMAQTLLDDYCAQRLPPKPGTIAAHQIAVLEAKLQRERQIVTSHLLGTPNAEDDGSLTREQKRQVTRRVLRHVTRQVRSEPRYEAARMTVQ